MKAANFKKQVNNFKKMFEIKRSNNKVQTKVV